MKPEVATRRIKTFGERFGEAHLYLAYHAAFPLALTPDLLYRMWANFQRDINGEALNIPWMAVADLLLSSLCDEVGHELYEIDTAVRHALLKELKGNSRFGDKRINELSDFLLAYVQQQLDNHDLDMRDFAQTQRWTALAYTRPNEVAREIASTLSKLRLEDKAEWIRMASLVETFAEPLAGFEPLLVYARGMASFVRNNLQSAEAQFNQLPLLECQVKIAGVTLDIPLETSISTKEDISLNKDLKRSTGKFALLIGVSEYEPGLTPLPVAIKDVKAMQRVLEDPEMGEFEKVITLINPERQTMEESLETLYFGRTKNDLVLLYFSGHGIKDDRGRLFLATSKTRKNSKGELFRTTAVAASLIHDCMEDSRSRRQVIILDCCFSGAFAEGMIAKNDGSLDIENQLAQTKKPQEVEGRVVLTSSTATQYSFEQQGLDLSVYTRYLVEGIEKGAADTDNDGIISVDELHEYARKKVQEVAPAMKPQIYSVREGYKIQLAKAPIGDPRLEYRKQVEQSVRDGQLSRVGRRILNRRHSELGLSADEASEIENEVLAPYRERQQNLQEYEEALTEALEDEGTLSHHTREDLKRLQQLFQLRDEDIAPIEARLTSPSTPTDTQTQK